MKLWSKKRALAVLSGLALATLALLGGVVYFVGSPEFEEMAADYTIGLIEERTGTTATLGSFEIDFWQRQIALDELELHGDEDPTEPPLIRIARIEIGFRLRSLLQRRIDLWSLRILEPEIFLKIGEGGETNVPSPRARTAISGGGSIPLEVAIGDFVLSSGGLRINESRVDIDFQLADVQGLFDFDEATRVLSGSLGYSGAIEGAVEQPIPYRLETEFDFTEGSVVLHPAVMTSDGTRLSIEGRIEDFLGSRHGTLDYTGDVDLPFLSYFLPDNRFSGVSAVTGSLAFSTRDFSTTGHASAERLEIDDWVATDFESDYSYAFPGRSVVATNLDSGFAGGRVRGAVTISPLPGSPVIGVELDYAGVAPELFGNLFPWGVDYVRSSAAGGTLEGWMSGGLEDFDLEGEIRLSSTGPGPDPGPGVTGSTVFHATPGEIEVRGLSASLGQARARADGLISRPILSLDATLEAEDLTELEFLYSFLYPGIEGSGGFQGRVSGSIDSPLFDGDFRYSRGGTTAEASGVVSPEAFSLEAIAASEDLRDLAFLHEGIYGTGSFAGEVLGSMEEPVLAGEFSASLGSTRVEASGRVSRPELDLDATLVSGDLSDLAFLYPGATGSGRISGRIQGSGAEPAFAGEVSLTSLAYRDWSFDRIEGKLDVTREQVSLGTVDVAVGSSSFRVQGRYRLDGSATDLDVAIAELDAELLEPVTSTVVGGLLSGRVHLTSLDPIAFEGSLEAEDLSYEGHPIGHMRAGVAYGPAEIRLSELRVELEDASAAGEVYYDRVSEEVDAEFDLEGQRLEQFYWLGVPDTITGRVRSAELALGGVRQEPLISGQLVLEDFVFGQQSFSLVSAGLRTVGRVLGARVETNESLQLETEIDMSGEGYPFDGNATFVDFDPGQLAGLEAGTLIASGNARFGGSLRDFGSLSGDGEIGALTASFGERTLDVTRPFTFEFNAREVRVSPVELIGQAGTSLELFGTIAIEAEAPLSLNVYGPLDLSLIGSQYEDLEMSGDVTLDLLIEGTVSDPLLIGVATLNDVSVGHADVFVGVSDLRGDLFLDGPRATLQNIRGDMSGGSVILSGTFGVAGDARGVMDIGVEAVDVRPRRLRGLRTSFGGVLGLRGTPEALILEGNVQLGTLSFNESFDEFLQLFDRGPALPPGAGLPDTLGLAVHVEGNRNIQVSNDLVSLEGRLDLDIGGTFGSPSLTGHSEITRGTLFLQGRRYRITRGNVDFVDPVGIDPRIDIQAEADIRDYRVSLLFTGRGDDPKMTMRSNPALPGIEIVSLIAGGRTIGELDQEAQRRGQSRSEASEELLFQGAASSILADMLQSRVGSRLGVLNSVRIDPFQVGAEGDPVTRLTVSRQITSDLEITYSQDLSSNSQEIIQIEYFLNGDTSFVASRDELGRLGLDIKLRKRFD